MRKSILLLTFLLTTTLVLAGPILELRYIKAIPGQKEVVKRGKNYPLLPSRERAIGYYNTMYAKSKQKKVILYVASDEPKPTEILENP
jgi:hypothetical protein